MIDLLIEKIHTNPEISKIALREFNNWLCSDKNDGKNIFRASFLLLEILQTSPLLAKDILHTLNLTFKYNKWISYSLLINIIHVDVTLVDDAFLLIKKYFTLHCDEGELVCLYKMLGMLVDKKQFLALKTVNLIIYLAELDSNGDYSRHQANLIINFIKTYI